MFFIGAPSSNGKAGCQAQFFCLLSFTALASPPLGRAADPDRVPVALRRDFAKIENCSEWRSEEITAGERKLRLILEMGRLDENDPKASIDGSIGVLFGIAGSSVLGAFEFKKIGKITIMSFTPIDGGGTPIHLPYHIEKDILIIDCSKIRWPGAGVLSKALKFHSGNGETRRVSFEQWNKIRAGCRATSQ